MISSLVTLLFALIIVGFILWILPRLPIDDAIIQIIRGLIILVTVIGVILFVLDIAGVYHSPLRLR